MSVAAERVEENDVSDTEHDRDSLVPVTGSITGDVTEDGCNDVSEMGEEVTEEECEQVQDRQCHNVKKPIQV